MATNQQDPAKQVAEATKIRDYVLQNASSMTEQQREEWFSRLWDECAYMLGNDEAIELIDEAFNKLDEYTVKIQRHCCDEDEEEEDDGPCRHGKKYSEPCSNCDEEAAEDEERAQKEADDIQAAVEYNLWYQDGGHKEVASWNTHG